MLDFLGDNRLVDEFGDVTEFTELAAAPSGISLKRPSGTSSRCSGAKTASSK